MAAMLLPGILTQAQTTITQWNFNSNPPDASNTTGSALPSIGTGTLTTVGGTTSAFASGIANGGSSDPATVDNTGLNITTFPTQGTNDKTAGIQFAVPTIGHTDISISFELRHSATEPRHYQIQYTTDLTASPVSWTAFASDSASTNDFWHAKTFNLSTITALNNKANAGFRIVAAFSPYVNGYVGSSKIGTYGTAGTWRFDMFTVSGTATTVPKVSFVGTQTNVTETTSTVNIIANITNGNSTASAVELELLPIGTASSGTDFVLPAAMQYSWTPNSTNANDTITISITNDLLQEHAEYFVLRFKNPSNLTLPGADSNHFTVYILDDDKQAPTASQQISLNHLTSFKNGPAGANTAGMVVHDPQSQKLFIANTAAGKLDLVHFTNPSAPSIDTSIVLTAYGNIKSVAVKNGIVAVAIENATNP